MLLGFHDGLCPVFFLRLELAFSSSRFEVLFWMASLKLPFLRVRKCLFHFCIPHIIFNIKHHQRKMQQIFLKSMQISTLYVIFFILTAKIGCTLGRNVAIAFDLLYVILDYDSLELNDCGSSEKYPNSQRHHCRLGLSFSLT